MEAVKLIHISAVLLSILFFVGRGVIMFRTPSFVGRTWVRRIAESIDTLLFLTGVTLVWITEQLPWQESWLGAKLILLLIYILLGMIAFHWGRGRAVKMAAWLAAVATYAAMVLIALSREPWPFTM